MECTDVGEFWEMSKWVEKEKNLMEDLKVLTEALIQEEWEQALQTTFSTGW